MSFVRILFFVVVYISVYVDAHFEKPRVKITNGDYKLVLTNIRYNGQTYEHTKKTAMAITPTKGLDFELWNKHEKKWETLGKYINAQKRKRVYFSGSKRTFPSAHFVDELRERMIKYGGHEIYPLYDTYYVIAAHGVEEVVPGDGDPPYKAPVMDWNYRSTLKFISRPWTIVHDEVGRRFQEKLLLGKVDEANQLVAGETVVKGGKFNQHYALWAAQFEDAAGVFRYIVTESDGQDADVTEDLLGLFPQSTNTAPVELTNIADVLDAMGPGIIYWNACRGGKSMKHLKKTLFHRLPAFDPELLKQYRDARLKRCKKSEHEQMLKTSKRISEVIKMSLEQIKQLSPGKDAEIATKMQTEQQKFQHLMVSSYKGKRKGTDKEFTHFACLDWAVFQRDMRTNINIQFESFKKAIKVILKKPMADDFDFDISDQTIQEFDDLAHLQYDNKYSEQDFGDDDKLLEMQEMINFLRRYRIARKSSKKRTKKMHSKYN